MAPDKDHKDPHGTSAHSGDAHNQEAYYIDCHKSEQKSDLSILLLLFSFHKGITLAVQMLYKEGMDPGGTARHTYEGKDHPYLFLFLRPPSPVASHNVLHMNVVSNTNPMVGLSAYRKNTHSESPLTM